MTKKFNTGIQKKLYDTNYLIKTKSLIGVSFIQIGRKQKIFKIFSDIYSVLS